MVRARGSALDNPLASEIITLSHPKEMEEKVDMIPRVRVEASDSRDEHANLLTGKPICANMRN